MAKNCNNCDEKCPQVERANQAALGRMYATKEFIALLKKVESGELAEVVRCKDCKHTRKKNGHEQFMYNENVCICTKEDIWGINKSEPVWSDGFCSYGERKADD